MRFIAVLALLVAFREMMRVAKDLHERWGAVTRELGVQLD